MVEGMDGDAEAGGVGSPRLAADGEFLGELKKFLTGAAGLFHSYRSAQGQGVWNAGVSRSDTDQGWSNRRTEASDDDQRRVLRLVKPSHLLIDARLQGPTLKVQDLLALEEGDVLAFDFSTEKSLNLLVNGRLKFQGQVAAQGKKKAFLIRSPYIPSE